MKNQIVTETPVKRVRRSKRVVEGKTTKITLDKGDKVSFHPYRKTNTVRGIIISRVPTTYERKKTHEKMELVTIKTVKGDILTKTTSSLKLLEKAS